MKRILLISAVLVSFGATAQTNVAAKNFPVLSNPNITGIYGEALDASYLLKNQVVRFNISLMNLDQKEVVKAGSYTIQIELDNKVKLANTEDILHMPLGNYFSWSVEKDATGKNYLNGKLIADLPTDFTGSTFINLRCMETGHSFVQALWISADKTKRSGLNAVDFTIVKNRFNKLQN
jgi:hypothetical protein